MLQAIQCSCKVFKNIHKNNNNQSIYILRTRSQLFIIQIKAIWKSSSLELDDDLWIFERYLFIYSTLGTRHRYTRTSFCFVGVITKLCFIVI